MMGNWRLCGSFGFRAAGILQVMGKPEVIQKPGVLQSVGGGGGTVLTFGQLEVRIPEVRGLEIIGIPEKIGVLVVMS